MPPGRKKCSANEKRIRAHVAERLESLIGRHRGAISKAARDTGINKQSLSMYMNGKATPTPETLRILCSKLPLNLNIEGIAISASDFRPRKSRSITNEQLALSLSDAILTIPQEHLKIQVLNRRSQSIDLKVTIDFASIPRIPKSAKRQTLAAAS
jgi:transcriptional regulator with XRE-family HTH domain